MGLVTFIGMDDRLRAAIGPVVLIVVMLVAIPAVMLWRLARQHQEGRRVGLCRSCGYDLRGGHDRCPECGANVPAEGEGDDPSRWGNASLSDLLLRHALEPVAERLRESDVPAPVRPLLQAAERRALGEASADEFAAAAIASLEAGLDGRYVGMLAGWTPATTLDPEGLMAAALREQGVEVPRRGAILHRRALILVDAFLNGELKMDGLAGALVAALGERNVRTARSPAYHLWSYASSWWADEAPSWRDQFEELATRAALDLRARLLTQRVWVDVEKW
jgi:hypothetical protein